MHGTVKSFPPDGTTLIGMHGAIANNLYVMAKAFRRGNRPVRFITESRDTFPFSQPIWEDVAFTLPYPDIDPACWDRTRWATLRTERAWTAPSFVYEDDAPTEADVLPPRRRLGSIEAAAVRLTGLGRSSHDRRILELMQTADVWVTSGVHATLLAWLSGKPSVIWPHGGDIRMAAEFGWNWKTLRPRRPSVQAMRWLLCRAYAEAIFIGSHDPSGSGGHVTRVPFHVRWLPIPLSVRRTRESAEERETERKSVLHELGVAVPAARYHVFIPSRIDYFWKGTDRLIEAIRSVAPKNTCFIFAGWGRDYAAAARAIGQSDRVIFLPCSISKPILYRMFGCVDLVIDQFMFGTYGTSAVEAMSQGTPVMMRIDESCFRDKGWVPPPVLNCETVEGIAEVLASLDAGRLDLESARRATLDWIGRTHAEEVAVPCIARTIEQALAERRP